MDTNTKENVGKVPTEKNTSYTDMELDDDDDDDHMYEPSVDLQEIGELRLTSFCKKASAAFFRQYGLINHQINSYNDFINHGIQRVFDSIGEIKVQPLDEDPSKKSGRVGASTSSSSDSRRYASIMFGEVQLERPQFDKWHKMLPRHCRIQNITYSARIKVKACLEVYTMEMNQKEVVKKVENGIIVGRIPVMVKSDLCWMKDADKNDCDFDLGGYFIVKGTEKVFLAQEANCLKRLWLSDTPDWNVAYRHPTRNRKVVVKLVESNAKGKNIHKVLRVYCMLVEVPIWVLFYALGCVSSDLDIVNLLDLNFEDERINNILIASIHEADKNHSGFRSSKEAINHIKKLSKESKFPPNETVEKMLTTCLFPGLTEPKLKARFLGYMVKCLLRGFTNRRKCDNRDDFRNKRLDLACQLLERELRVHVKHAERIMVKAMQKKLNYGGDHHREITDYSTDEYWDASIITNGISRAFSTGGWSHPFKSMTRVSGVVANLRRTNPLVMISDLRKSRQQITSTARIAADLVSPQPSHWGRHCFLSTPDGDNSGLVKNLSMTVVVSSSITNPSLVEKLIHYGMEKLVEDSSSSFKDKHKILLDGEWVGVCSNSLTFVQKLRRQRRRKHLPSQVEIKRDSQNKEVRIFCDAGRLLRPLLVVENLKRIGTLLKGNNYTFQTLLDTGIIELIGIEEEEDCCTAWGINYLFNKDHNYTHCELDSSFLLGLSCGIIPYANHDHARRVLYQSEKHSAQAMGFPTTTNPSTRVDTLSHQLYYPQKPLFRTAVADCLGSRNNQYFNGQSVILAVNVHLGYNQEDSVVMNRSSLERGMFRTEHIRCYKAAVLDGKELASNRKLSDDVVFRKTRCKVGRVDKLDDDGLPYVSADLQPGDVIIGKGTASGSDQSVKLKHTEKGVVQRVILSANDDGKNLAFVSLRQVRSPCLGDKFSSMHGQKGVIGFLDSQENFPFNNQGIVPDVVINPHAFPSRQTVGQLLEAALGKGIACGGSLKYATPYSATSVEAIGEQLHRLGFSRWGVERVCNGRTGEMVKSMIFMGPAFYQRLTHMTEDKIKFRNAIGPIHNVTHQPVSDRKRFGGIKFGEMERDCLIAHGAAINIHERLFTLSDVSEMCVCTRCKNPAAVIQRSINIGYGKVRGPYCMLCKSGEQVAKLMVPHGTKLLTHELMCMGIALKFETQPC